MGKEAVCVPAGHEESLHELRSGLRDRACLHPQLHPWHGQGSEDVPSQVQLVAACHPLLHPDLLLRRDEKVLAEAQSRRMDRERDLLLISSICCKELFGSFCLVSDFDKLLNKEFHM